MLNIDNNVRIITFQGCLTCWRTKQQFIWSRKVRVVFLYCKWILYLSSTCIKEYFQGTNRMKTLGNFLEVLVTVQWKVFVSYIPFQTKKCVNSTGNHCIWRTCYFLASPCHLKTWRILKFHQFPLYIAEAITCMAFELYEFNIAFVTTVQCQ